ncbi:MAG: hypothetical protein GWN93_04300 [Deltaproteobacteria bacterium]|nr:hypothetical protein [Deltaproteobacteria bacterium]
MNTLFRICIVICLGLLIFSLAVSYLEGTGAFEVSGGAGKDIGSTSTVLGDATDIDETNMNYIWGVVITSTIVGAIGSYFMHSVVPIGISIFSSVFWASFINTHGILSVGGYIPGDLMTIFTIVTVFVFIGACVGMLTGSG